MVSKMLQAGERPAKAGIGRDVGPRRARIITVAALYAALLMIQSAASPAASSSGQSARYWKGKNISEVHKKLGNPTQMTPLVETGGTLYIYAHRGEPHWAFETDPGGKIVKAARIE